MFRWPTTNDPSPDPSQPKKDQHFEIWHFSFSLSLFSSATIPLPSVSFERTLLQMFSASMRSSPPPDIMGTYSATFAPTTYYHGSPSGATNSQPYLGFDTLNTTRNTTNMMGSSLLGPSSPPRRRYSIGGLPSASITEYLNLMQSANESAHLSNLLNETSKSITRSSQILGVSSETSALPGYEAVLSGQFGDTCADTTAFQSDNLLSMPLANYSSQPNIYPLPNYASTSAFYEPTASSYLSHQKSFANFPSYSRPSHNVSFTHPLATATSSYIAPHRPCSNLGGPYQSALSLSRQNLFMPTHHTSNPALSSGGAHNTWIPSSHNRLAGATDPYTNSISQYNHQPSSSSMLGTTQHYFDLPSHHHHQHHSTTNNHHTMPLSSTIGGGGGGGGGYANQHFDHHYYQTPLQQQNQQQLAKLDLEYSKQGETQKRQVSFKFDVDNLSVDS